MRDMQRTNVRCISLIQHVYVILSCKCQVECTYKVRTETHFSDGSRAMIMMHDYTAALPERKSQRKELRLKPTVEQKIRSVAAYLGMDESTFIASAAYRAAQEIEASQFVTVLPQEQFDAFAAAVDAPAKGNDALTALLVKSRSTLVRT